MALGGALGPAWAPGTPRHFAWQAWHLVTSTFDSRGRRGTNSHPPSFGVAGVGQMALGGALGPAWAPGTPRHLAWQAWHLVTSTFDSRGRRGTNSHPPSFGVAGVGQMALGGALGPAWAPGTPRHLAWQPWHLVTFTFDSRGRRGTNSHPPSFGVAGVGQMALGGALGPAWAPGTPRHLAWQAWHLVTSTFDLYVHVLVSSDGQRLTLRAKLLYDPVYLRVPVVEDGKVCPWNKPAFAEICEAIQHASV